MSPKIATLLCAFALVAAGLEVFNEVDTQYVTISKRYPGIDLPGKDPLVLVELVYDATCKESLSKVETAQSSIRFGSRWKPNWSSLTPGSSVLGMHCKSFLIAFSPTNALKLSDMFRIRKAQRLLYICWGISFKITNNGLKKPSLIPRFLPL